MDHPVIDEGFAARHARLAALCSPQARMGARADPDDPAAVLAMQIVLHIPKRVPPARSGLLAAAAAASVAVCLDERVSEGGAWDEPVAAWMSSRIRKVARRARGAQWAAVQELDGVTSTVNGAQARAFVPGPVGALDSRLKRLQISGTDLENDTPGADQDDLPVLWVNSSLGMTVGKEAAQVGHASMLLAAALSTARVAKWASNDYACTVREADPGRWAQLLAAGGVVVRDAGFTEIAPGSPTVIACW
ncbi:aminoacyl-tRNA hydrolase [Hoyosella subflava]